YDYCVVAQDGKIIDIRELASIDELIVRGYENTVYSINVLKGHGYISLQNEDYFMGGIVTVGNEVGLEITEGMLIMAEEGKHILSVTKNGVGGAVEVNVERGKEVFVDVGPLQGEAVMHGSVYFTITPENATLIIDGKVQNHEDLVELPFGTYRIAVEAVGYVPYMGDLVVGDTFIRRNISLGLEEKSTEVVEPETTSPEETTPEETTSTPEETTAPGGDAGQDTTTGTEGELPIEEETTVIHTGEKDVSKYKIYVESPIGAEVYFDSEYVGIAPLEFEKQSGLHTIIFKRDGYQMKAYVLEISQEACDEHYSFLPLEKTE
ncbi:MAG: PEGA domain-containing protein, partial [Lachnospiraceae bacterium]|nr:PEGA domain-containing protein [Lachnospiraceae bacterium]